MKLSPSYIPLIQKPSCCAAACLQMILQRNGFGLHDQEQIAIKFGIKIREKFAPAFSPQMPIANPADGSYGLNTIDSVGQINQFMNENGFPLKANSFRFSEIKNLPEFIIESLSYNSDLWVEYKANQIHKNDANNGLYVHDGLIESIDSSNESVIIIDSVPEHRQRILVKISDLEEAISSVFGEETGFVIVSKK